MPPRIPQTARVAIAATLERHAVEQRQVDERHAEELRDLMSSAMSADDLRPSSF